MSVPAGGEPGTGPVRLPAGVPQPGWSLPPGWSPYPGLPPEATPERPAPRRRLVPLAIAAAAAGLGAPFGLVWAALAPRVPLRVTEAGLVYAEAQPEQVAAADGWFAVLAVPFGVLLGLGAWLAGRRARGVATLLALAAGAVGAGLIAWWLGARIGLSGYQASVAAADPGTVVDRPPDLAMAEAGWWPPRVTGVPLVPALAAAATYTLLAAWSRFPNLQPERPGPQGGP